MSVAQYLENNFYPWAKIILVKMDSEKILYEGEVGNCKNYLSNKVKPKPINFSKDVTKIEVII